MADAEGKTKRREKEGFVMRKWDKWGCQETRERANVSGTNTVYRQTTHCQQGPADYKPVSINPHSHHTPLSQRGPEEPVVHGSFEACLSTDYDSCSNRVSTNNVFHTPALPVYIYAMTCNLVQTRMWCTSAFSHQHMERERKKTHLTIRYGLINLMKTLEGWRDRGKEQRKGRNLQEQVSSTIE